MGAEAEVFADRQVGEDAPAFRDHDDAELRETIGRKACDVLVGRKDPAAFRLEQAADRAHERRFAGAVGAENGRDLALGHGQRNVAIDRDGPISGVDVLDFEQGQRRRSEIDFHHPLVVEHFGGRRFCDFGPEVEHDETADRSRR